MNDQTATRFLSSVFVKIAGLIAVAGIVMVVAVEVLNIRGTSEFVQRLVSKSTQIEAQNLAQNLSGAVRFGKTDDITQKIDATLEAYDGSLAGIAVADAEGALLASSGSLPEDINERVGLAVQVEEAEALGSNLFQFAPIFGKGDAPVGYVAVLANMGPAQATLDEIRDQVLIASAVALLVSLGASFLILSSVLVRPLNRLRDGMISIREGRFDESVPGANRRDELGAMARVLTTLRDNLSVAADEAVVTAFKSTAFSGSAVAMIMADKDRRVLEVNTAAAGLFADNRAEFAKLSEGSEDAFVGRNFDPIFRMSAQTAAEIGDVSNLPFKGNFQLGDRRYSYHVAASHNADGIFTGYLIELQDQTDILLNAGLINSLQSVQGVIQFTPEREVAFSNDVAARMVGVTASQMTAKHLTGATKEDEAKFDQAWKSALSGKPTEIEICRRHPKTGIVHQDLMLFPVKDSSGNVFRVIELGADLTETRKLAEQTEREREAAVAAQRLVMEELGAGLQHLADGDLLYQIENRFPDAYDALRGDFNATVEKVRASLADLISVTENITNGATEIAQASDDLSRRTENQAATLEETAAALDEMTASVKSSADGASNAEQRVNSARSDAEKGGAVVVDAVSAMQEIETSANQISQIIGVIEDIAFQTNLLALNAGVEAARAGEAGRGFAVVASEVRALAQRSSDAAREIKTLISSSTEHVANGVSLVNKTGDALSGIVESVTTISVLVTSMAQASREQSTGLTEINAGMTHLDDVTQKNAAMVEQSTAASYAMKSDADRLSEVIGRFQIGSDVVELVQPGVVGFEDTPEEEVAAPNPEPLAPNARDIAPKEESVKPEREPAANDTLEGPEQTPRSPRRAVAAGTDFEPNAGGWEEF